MTLILSLRFLAAHGVWDARQECRHTLHERLQVATLQLMHGVDEPRGGVFLGLQVVIGYESQESFPHLIVRNIKQEAISIFIIALDGKITTLIYHRQRLFHISLIVIKL